MTPFEIIDKARAAWPRLRPLLLPAAVVLLALLWAGSCNGARRAAAEASRLTEEAKARAAAVPVVAQVEDLRPQLDAALAANRELAAELERAKAAVPGARPVGVVRAGTSAVAASGSARPADPPGAAAPPALLAAGDLLRLEMDEVLLQGKSGAHMLVGTQSAYRVADGALLARAAFSAPVTEAAEKPPLEQPAPRWRAGPLGVVGDRGWLLGGLLATPQARLPLLGWSVEAQGGAAAGPGGVQGQVSVLFGP